MINGFWLECSAGWTVHWRIFKKCIFSLGLDMLWRTRSVKTNPVFSRQMRTLVCTLHTIQLKPAAFWRNPFLLLGGQLFMPDRHISSKHLNRVAQIIYLSSNNNKSNSGLKRLNWGNLSDDTVNTAINSKQSLLREKIHTTKWQQVRENNNVNKD